MAFPYVFAGVSAITTPQLDADFNAAGLLGTIPCQVSGTNTLTLTPYTTPTIGTPPLTLQAMLRVSGVAAHSNSGAVTANVGGLGALPVYRDGATGPVALTGNEIIANNYFVLAYDAALNSGNGGWHLQNATSTAAGTVTSLVAGGGLAGGTITTTGTVSLSTAADSRLLANISGGVAVPSANTLTGILDAIMSSTQGAILNRGASVWAASVEQAWTPALAFGGSSTGITYSTQVGRYYAAGFLVWAMFNLVLTSKGAQTGSATLSLPATAGGTNRVGSVIITNYANFGAITTQPFGNIVPSATTANLYIPGTATVDSLDDTDFANNTSLSGMMMYLTG